MARYKRLATILRDVDYKKTYKPTKTNAEMFFNVLNYAIIFDISKNINEAGSNFLNSLLNKIN